MLRLFPIVGRPEAAPMGYGAAEGGGGGATSRRASFVHGGGNSFRQSTYGGQGATSGTARRRRGIVRGAGRRVHHQVRPLTPVTAVALGLLAATRQARRMGPCVCHRAPVKSTARASSLCSGVWDTVCSRLAHVLAGWPFDRYQVGAKAEFHTKIGDEYNAKWRLLSSFIDAVSRWVHLWCQRVGFQEVADLLWVM